MTGRTSEWTGLINCSKISFTYHYHVRPWTLGTDAGGNSTHVYDTFDPATCCHQATYEIALGSETAAGILSNIQTILDGFEEDNGDTGVDADSL